MIDIQDLSKVYLVGDERVRALDHATLHIYPHEFVSIIGPSGSGKSTLMNIIGCLDVAADTCWTACPLNLTAKTNWPGFGTRRSASCSRAST